MNPHTTLNLAKIALCAVETVLFVVTLIIKNS